MKTKSFEPVCNEYCDSSHTVLPSDSGCPASRWWAYCNDW